MGNRRKRNPCFLAAHMLTFAEFCKNKKFSTKNSAAALDDNEKAMYS